MHNFINFSSEIPGSTFAADVVKYVLVRMNFGKFPALLIQTWDLAGFFDVKLYWLLTMGKVSHTSQEYL
jgi:hypothetical protein